ncbi:MAG: aminotransferase class IV [Candidatus Omnitrophica bacterium]|nr:aminotransferase class IV [Candidatus Omnitrophota bacterium]
MKKIIFLNGKFIPADEARVSVLAPGFLNGLGLFETMRAYQGKIVYLDAHLKRITLSSRLLRLRSLYSLKELRNLIRQAVKSGGFDDAYVRLTITKSFSGTDTLLIVKEHVPLSANIYLQGFSLCLHELARNPVFLPAQVKTTSRIFFELAYQQAREKGFDEALILDDQGYISEASRSNIFLIRGSEIFTPGLDCGCLDGITRRVIFDLAAKFKIAMYTGKLVIQDLLDADEAFLTNSLIGVMPLARLERKKIGDARCGKLTKFLQVKYSSLLS